MKIKSVNLTYGIICQENMGEGNIIKHTSEDGKITYRENASAGLSGLREGEEWVEAKDINTIYVLVDNNSHNTVAGVGRIAYGNQYDEFIVEKVFFENANNTRIEYQLNPDYYVYLSSLDEENNLDMQEFYEEFSAYYNDRVTQQNKGMEH